MKKDDVLLSVTVFAPSRALTSRLVNQTGVFIEMPENTDLLTYVQSRFDDQNDDRPHGHAVAVLTRIVIPNKDREGCLKALDKMNINRFSLFRDLDNAARHINASWELDCHTVLKWLPEYGAERDRS